MRSILGSGSVFAITGIDAGVAVASKIDAAGAGVSVLPNALAVPNAITARLGDPEWLAQAGERARELARTEYLQAAMGRGLLEMYADACSNDAVPMR